MFFQSIIQSIVYSIIKKYQVFLFYRQQMYQTKIIYITIIVLTITIIFMTRYKYRNYFDLTLNMNYKIFHCTRHEQTLNIKKVGKMSNSYWRLFLFRFGRNLTNYIYKYYWNYWYFKGKKRKKNTLLLTILSKNK